MKKIIILAVSLLLSFSIFTSPNASASAFTGNSHEKSLTYLAENNILLPDKDGKYYPYRSVTRGEFASYLAKILQLPASSESTFTDVYSTNPFAKDILSAAEVGIITGYPDGSFKPNNIITRQHMAVMISRVLDYLVIPKNTGTLTFTDSKDILEEYITDVSIGANLGIIKGSTEGNKVFFYPQKSTTIAQSATFIYRLVEVAKENGYTDFPDFFSFEVKEIVNKQLVNSKQYKTFEDAQKGVTKNNQVIERNGKIIKMPSGLVITNGYTVVYSHPKEETRYVTTSATIDTEMEYLGTEVEEDYSGKKIFWAKVQYADRIGYVKLDKATLKPYVLLTNRSYYIVSNGELKHTIYYNSTNREASYIIGKAPSVLQEGKKYYSWNGYTFYNENNTAITGEYFNYYQFLPARSKTNYTVEEIDSYIMSELTRLENLYTLYPTSYPNYKDATVNSKLVGLGEVLKLTEEKYQVNALMILALAQNESAYGLSNQALTNNNLFGLYVTDTNPLNKKFTSVESNITELMEKFWNLNYIPPTAGYANGAVFGNKTIGFNVRYASDPYWGAKAAGQYYKIDKFLGFKDAGTYKIGMTTTSGVNVRKDASLNFAAAFTYKLSNMPVIIMNPDINGFVEVLSDSPSYQNLYIHKDLVRELNIIK